MQRAVAWGAEMRRVHEALREALEVARESLDSGEPATEGMDLLLYCWGYCSALDGHHRSEDTVLFPHLAATHPELGEVLGKLRQDHSMMSHLIRAAEEAMRAGAGAEVMHRHLDGISAIMESHFGYEERQLLAVLDGLGADDALDATPQEAFGPLA